MGPGTNESAVAALPGGTLVLHSRAAGHRFASLSHDGGASWSAPLPIGGLPHPGDNGSLVALAPSAHDAGSRASAPGPPGVLLASSNLDPELRRNTALGLSRDGGATWPHQLVLCEGSSGYAAELPDGRIGVLYEREGCSEIQGTSSPSTHGCGCPREWRRPG